ncbi:MAG: beta-N-acetylhexosaminidase, partial [Acidobacteriota bacterium]
MSNKFCFCALILVGIVFPSNIFGGQPNIAIQVIPEPKQIETTNEIFKLKAGSAISPADSRSAADLFAANDFIADVKQTANIALKIGRGNILIGSLADSRIKKEFAKVNFQIPADLSDEGYVLIVGANKIIVGGKTEAGTFYGLQTLKQLVRGEGANVYVQGVKIIDYPTMRYRAFSDDISRGIVPKLDYVKRQIRTFAALKMNMHSLYMEHTFRSRSHPLFAP